MTPSLVSTPVRATLAAAAALLLALPAAAADGPVDTAFDAALQQYENCHWPQAFQAFAALADAGNPEAARIATQMARHGVPLYGQRFSVEPARADAWRRAASRVAGLRR